MTTQHQVKSRINVIKNLQENKTMANPQTQSNKNTSTQNPKSAEAPKTDAPKTADPTPATAAATPTGDWQPVKGEQKERYNSTKNQTYHVRVLPSIVARFGAPKDPWGGDMVLRAKDPEALKKAKEAEKAAKEAKLAGMSDEQKLAFAKQEREAKQAEKAKKKAAERAALVAQIEAELAAAGRLVPAKQ